jgi:hypothetical protein
MTGGCRKLRDIVGASSFVGLLFKRYWGRKISEMFEDCSWHATCEKCIQDCNRKTEESGQL